MLEFADVLRLANEAVERFDQQLEVIGLTPGEGGTSYVEVVFAVHRHEGPPRLMVGIDRRASAVVVAAHLHARLHSALG